MKEVLIVDDSRAIRSILKRIFTAQGFNVHEAANGVQALERLSTDAAGVSLLCADYNMPEMNGLELLRRVRADTRHNSMPVLMVTSETSVSVLQKALESGASEYLMKPFTADMVVEKLEILGVTAACA